MNCCNDFGHCTGDGDCAVRPAPVSCCEYHAPHDCNQGRDCPVRRARAADEQVTLPPYEELAATRINKPEPFHALEKVLIVFIVFVAYMVCAGLIWAGAYHLLPHGIA